MFEYHISLVLKVEIVVFLFIVFHFPFYICNYWSNSLFIFFLLVGKISNLVEHMSNSIAISGVISHLKFDQLDNYQV